MGGRDGDESDILPDYSSPWPQSTTTYYQGPGWRIGDGFGPSSLSHERKTGGTGDVLTHCHASMPSQDNRKQHPASICGLSIGLNSFEMSPSLPASSQPHMPPRAGLQPSHGQDHHSCSPSPRDPRLKNEHIRAMLQRDGLQLDPLPRFAPSALVARRGVQFPESLSLFPNNQMGKENDQPWDLSTVHVLTAPRPSTSTIRATSTGPKPTVTGNIRLGRKSLPVRRRSTPPPMIIPALTIQSSSPEPDDLIERPLWLDVPLRSAADSLQIPEATWQQDLEEECDDGEFKPESQDDVSTMKNEEGGTALLFNAWREFNGSNGEGDRRIIADFMGEYEYPLPDLQYPAHLLEYSPIDFDCQPMVSQCALGYMDPYASFEHCVTP